MPIFLKVAWAEWCDLLKDLGVLMVLVGGTLFYAFFYPMPYSPQNADKLPIAVVDHDQSVSSREFIRMLNATPEVQIVAYLSGQKAIQESMQRQDIYGALVIPTHFERDLSRGKMTQVDVWGNGGYILILSQVVTAASGTASAFGTQIGLRALSAAGLPYPEAKAKATPVATGVFSIFNPGAGYATYVVPAVLTLLFQQTLLIAMGMRGRGVELNWPSNPYSAAFGRILPYVVLQLFLAAVTVHWVYALYDLPHRQSLGSALWLYTPYMLSIALLGALIGHFFKTRETALQILMMTSIPILFLSGFAWPKEVIPGPLELVGNFFPSTPAIEAYLYYFQMASTWEQVHPRWLQLWALCVLYALCLGGAVAWRQYRSGKAQQEASK